MSSSVGETERDSTVVALPMEATRRHLSTRQARTVQRLTDAAVAELREVRYDGLTVRNVAGRAGVAPATAYTYFASKDHLVAEVFWRLLDALPERRADRRAAQVTRVSRALADIALLVADEPEVAAAVSSAMLAADPDVKVLRDRIGAEMHRRVVAALDDPPDPVVVRTLDLALAGALLHAGMGHVAYQDLPELLAGVASVVLDHGSAKEPS